jgi:hypothetical protein
VSRQGEQWLGKDRERTVHGTGVWTVSVGGGRLLVIPETAARRRVEEVPVELARLVECETGGLVSESDGDQ